MFVREGTPDLTLRTTKIVLSKLPAIRGGNSGLRSAFARNCSGRDFEFFNRIGRKPPLL
jgi:hypothetical protein